MMMPLNFSHSCNLVDVIKSTLSLCSWVICNNECREYLIFVGDECPVVFHNEKYEELWEILMNVCISPK